MGIRLAVLYPEDSGDSSPVAGRTLGAVDLGPVVEIWRLQGNR